MAIFLAALAAVATIGRPERAARLFAAEARLERLGMRIQPPDVAQHLRNVAEVRAVLDDATFARAWTEGSSMSLDQALADVQTAARLAFAEEHPPANRTAPPDWREREVAALIAERTPYKHVANVPSKRNFAAQTASLASGRPIWRRRRLRPLRRRSAIRGQAKRNRRRRGLAASATERYPSGRSPQDRLLICLDKYCRGKYTWDMAKREPVSSLDDHLGYWLRRLSDAVHMAFERRLAAHGVTVSQWGVLVAVFQGVATTPLEVARYMAIDNGAVTRLIDRLVAKGLVRRESDQSDRRSVRLTLTAAGRDLAPALAALADVNDTVFFDPLTATERRQFARLLVQLLKARGIEATGRWQADDDEDPALRSTLDARGDRERDEE